MSEREQSPSDLQEEFREEVGEPAATPPPEDVPHVIVQRTGQIELERRRHGAIQTWSVTVLATGAVLTLMYFAKPVLIVILVSVLISFALTPIVEFCERFFHLPKSLGALIAVLLLVGALYGVTWVSYTRAVDFMQQLPKYSGRVRETVLKFRHRAEQFKRQTESVIPSAPEEKNTVKVQQTSTWGDWISQSAMNTAEIVLLASFVPFLVYFMLSWQEHVRSSTVMLFKMEHRNTAYVTLGLMSAMIRGFIVGNLVVGIFMSIAGTIVFGLLGLPYFYFIGVISGFLTLVPYLGVVLALVPPIAAGLGQSNAEQLLLITATVFGLHLFALNVLYPKIIGKKMQLNPLAVTIALLFWGWLWGAMGLILAVPITGALKILFDHIDSLRPYGAWLGE
jgi:predicted PurR-regulated permease PerM